MSTFRQLMFGKRNRIKHYMDLTVVGSPTISNGVVSGFSNSNYLKMSSFIASDLDTIEEKITFTTGAISGTQWIFSQNQNNVLIGLYLNSAGKLRIPFVENNGSTIYCSLEYVLSENTKYSVRILRNINGIVTATLYDNNENILDTNTNSAPYSFTGTSDSFWGVTASGGHGNVFNGSIDFNPNNSYIVLKGTKYILTLP